MTYFFVLLMTLIGAIGAFFFKRSTQKADGLWQLFRIPSFFCGAGLYVTSALLNVVLLRFMDYTILYPMTAITYIWTLIISALFLREKITKGKIAGIILVCLGVFILCGYSQ